MSANEVMAAFEEPTLPDRVEVSTLPIQKIIARRNAAKAILGKKLSFDEACDIVFRENRELPGSPAK